MDRSDVQPHIPFPASGSYPTREGNAVRPLVDGIPTFRRICGAVEAARHSVWVTVTVVAPEFQLPDGHGSLFDLLDRAVARGLDVRVIFWRPDAEGGKTGSTFSGTEAERDVLRARGSRFRIRWDRAHSGALCHHQKCWLVDAGQPSEIAFLGGVNLTLGAVATPGHPGDGQFHDLYVEVAGPSASDVHHGFVQRWNGASERGEPDGVWGHSGCDDLAFPTRPSSRRGTSLVQIQRTVPAGHYSSGHPAPGGRPYDIAGGERAIFEQYLLAIDAARSSIYIENQALPVPEIAVRIEAALQRGVDVVILAPAEPEGYVNAARRDLERRAHFDQIEALGRYETFALVGIAGRDNEGRRNAVYVHAKAMLIDDAWATIGSCNLHMGSLFRQTEMNASFWDPEVVRALRCELLAEHLDRDTSDLDDRAALRLYRKVAEENRRKRDASDLDWQGLAFRLDPGSYGT